MVSTTVTRVSDLVLQILESHAIEELIGAITEYFRRQSRGEKAGGTESHDDREHRQHRKGQRSSLDSWMSHVTQFLYDAPDLCSHFWLGTCRKPVKILLHRNCEKFAVELRW